MQLARSSSFLSTMFTVCLLLALGAVLVSAQPAPPNCVPIYGVKTVTAYDSGGVTIQITTPNTFRSCPTQGCCDTITITGVPAGWRITGQLISSFVFTMMCPSGRVTLETIPVDKDGGSTITLKVCYPNVHSWPSFETHVDVMLDILDASGVRVGGIGPGTDWDTYCDTVGCTPGKWKNWTGLGPGNQTNLWPSPYIPSVTTFYQAFGVYYTGNSSLTMLQALQLGGSGERGMARHCTAALLNARWAQLQPWNGNVCQLFANGTPDPSDVIGWVVNAYSGAGGETFASAMQKCAAMNESICALDGVWMNTSDGFSECGGTENFPCNNP